MLDPNPRLYPYTVTVYPITYGEASHGGAIPQDGGGVVYPVTYKRTPLSRIPDDRGHARQVIAFWMLQITADEDPQIVTDQHLDVGGHYLSAVGRSWPQSQGVWGVQCQEVS